MGIIDLCFSIDKFTKSNEGCTREISSTYEAIYLTVSLMYPHPVMMSLCIATDLTVSRVIGVDVASVASVWWGEKGSS